MPNLRNWKADDWKAFFVLTGGMILLTISALLGEIHRRNKLGTVNREAGKAVFSSAEDVGFPREQREFLSHLEEFISGASVHQAAKRLAEDRQQLRAIRETAGQIFGEEVLYFYDGRFVSSFSGMGLAIREDDVCFYGNFRNGRPEGVCTAIACGDEESSGYEYSMGIWKNGQMEGLGITGKYSWDEDRKEEGLEEQISGVFQKDRLDGKLTYEQVDAKGRSCWWEITAEEGKTCLDPRWAFWQPLGEYRLLSEREERAFFVVPQNLLEQVWWENRVPWES